MSPSSLSLELHRDVAGCPPMITRGTIVGETEGVERVDEAGDELSSSDEGDNVGFAFKSGDEAWGDSAQGDEIDGVTREVGGA